MGRLFKKFTYCYNITPSLSLDFKYTPYELIFGRNPYLLEVFESDNVDPPYNIDNFAKELKYKLQTAHLMANKVIKFLLLMKMVIS